jgi:hypothetical protein
MSTDAKYVPGTAGDVHVAVNREEVAAGARGLRTNVENGGDDCSWKATVASSVAVPFPWLYTWMERETGEDMPTLIGGRGRGKTGI